MINYSVVSRKSPKDQTVKYYAQAKSYNALTIQNIASLISRECTVTIHDVKAVLSALEEQVIAALQNGNSVRLGDLGSFHVTVNSGGCDKKEDFKASMIKRVNVRFAKSSLMRSGFRRDSSDIRFMNILPALTTKEEGSKPDDTDDSEVG